MALYKRGDIVAVQFPFTDISKTKKRPALVISNDTVNDTGDYLLVQITSQVKRDNLSVAINDDDFVGSSLPLNSFIRIHKMFLLNESLIHNRITSVSPSFLSLLTDNFTKTHFLIFDRLSYSQFLIIEEESVKKADPLVITSST